MQGWGSRLSQQGGNPQTSSSLARRLSTLGLPALSPRWGQSAPATLHPHPPPRAGWGRGCVDKCHLHPRSGLSFLRAEALAKSHPEERRCLPARGRPGRGKGRPRESERLGSGSPRGPEFQNRSAKAIHSRGNFLDPGAAEFPTGRHSSEIGTPAPWTWKVAHRTLHLPAGRPCPNTHTLGFWAGTQARAPWLGCRKPQPFLELNCSPSGEQGAEAEGRTPAPEADFPAGPRPLAAPRSQSVWPRPWVATARGRLPPGFAAAKLYTERGDLRGKPRWPPRVIRGIGAVGWRRLPTVAP